MKDEHLTNTHQFIVRSLASPRGRGMNDHVYGAAFSIEYSRTSMPERSEAQPTEGLSLAKLEDVGEAEYQIHTSVRPRFHRVPFGVAFDYFHMTYRFTQGPERWKIDPLKFDQLNRWQLYRAVDESWKGLRLFSTAEAAMTAVAEGNTGVDAWDATSHDRGAFTPDKWSAETW